MTRAGREGGFVLIAVIWFVAVLALVAAVISGWVSRSLAAAGGFEARIDARRHLVDATNETAYLVTTNFFSVRGLEMLQGEALAKAEAIRLPYVMQGGANPYIALDNRSYRYADGTIRLQDMRGLYNLMLSERGDFDDMMRVYGIPYEDRGALWDRLRDYVGAGSADGDAPAYAAAGRPPPRRTLLLTPWEMRRILGWDQESGLWQGPDALPEETTVGLVGGFNPNTAPARVLRALPGMTDEAVARVIQYRRRQTLTSDPELAAAAGIHGPILDPMRTLWFPGDSVRLELALPDEPLTWVIAISKRVVGDAPYRIDYAYARPRQTTLPREPEVSRLPPFPGSAEPR